MFIGLPMNYLFISFANFFYYIVLKSSLNIKYPLVHSLNKYALNTHYVTGFVLGSGIQWTK